jgi:hypothetical protein
MPLHPMPPFEVVPFLAESLRYADQYPLTVGIVVIVVTDAILYQVCKRVWGW